MREVQEQNGSSCALTLSKAVHVLTRGVPKQFKCVYEGSTCGS
jgi:hypothetical protein